MTELRQTEYQVDGQTTVARIQANVETTNHSKTLVTELKTAMANFETQQNINQDNNKTALKLKDKDLEMKLAELLNNKQIALIEQQTAMQTEGLMARAALAKAATMAMDKVRDIMKDMMRWDVRNDDSALSYYNGNDGQKSALKDRILRFFDQAAESYDRFTEDFSVAYNDLPEFDPNAGNVDS